MAQVRPTQKILLRCVYALPPISLARSRLQSITRKARHRARRTHTHTLSHTAHRTHTHTQSREPSGSIVGAQLAAKKNKHDARAKKWAARKESAQRRSAGIPARTVRPTSGRITAPRGSNDGAGPRTDGPIVPDGAPRKTHGHRRLVSSFASRAALSIIGLLAKSRLPSPMRAQTHQSLR